MGPTSDMHTSTLSSSSASVSSAGETTVSHGDRSPALAAHQQSESVAPATHSALSRQTADLVAGAGVLYLASAQGLRTSCSATFSSLDTLTLDAHSESQSATGTGAKAFLHRLVAGLGTPTTAVGAPAGPEAAGLPVGVWRRAWVVGRLSTGPEEAVLLSPTPMSSAELWRLRGRLGLTLPGDTCGKPEMDDPRHCHQRGCSGRPMRRIHSPLRGGLEAAVQLSGAAGGDEDDENPTAFTRTAAEPITLGLLTAPVEEQLRPHRTLMRAPPITLVAVRESVLAPLPHNADDGTPLELVACADRTSAEATLLYTLGKKLSFGANVIVDGPPLLLRVAGPHALDVAAARRSTWLCMYYSGSALGRVSYPDPRDRDAAELIGELRRAPVGEERTRTVVLLPASTSSSSLLLFLLLHVNERAHAALQVVAQLVPLSACTICVTLETPPKKDAAPVSLSVDTHFLFSVNGVSRIVDSLARLAAASRAELEDQQSSAIDTSTTTTSRTTAWSFTALLQPPEGEQDATFICARKDGIGQLANQLLTAGVPAREIRSFMATMLGLACLAAVARQPEPRRAWYRSEARELLGVLPSEHNETPVFLSLTQYLIDALLSASTVDSGTDSFRRANATSSVEAPSKGCCSLRLVQLPSRGQNGTAAASGALALLADALDEWADRNARAAGTARAMRTEAEVEGVWAGPVADSFTRCGVSPVETATAATAQTTLARLVQVIHAHTRSDGGSGVLSLCREILASFTSDELTATPDGVVTVHGTSIRGGARSYSLHELLKPTAEEEQLWTAAKMQWEVPPPSSASSHTCPLLVQEWLARLPAGPRPPTTARSVLATDLTGDTVVTVSAWICGGQQEADERQMEEWLLRGVKGTGAVDAFSVGSLAYVHAIPIADMCSKLLAGAVRAYCCCSYDSRSSGDSRRDQHRFGGTAVASAGVTAFSAPTGERRAIYVRFLQLTAAARYRDACRLCVRELPAARGLAVGVSRVLAHTADLVALCAATESVTNAAAKLLQRVGRGHRTRVGPCAMQFAEKRRAAVAAAARAEWERRLPSTEARDRAAWAEVERCAVTCQQVRERERAYSSTGVRVQRATTASAANVTTLEMLKRASHEWRETAVTLHEELSSTLSQAAAFEAVKAREERAASERVRLYRWLLRAAYEREVPAARPDPARRATMRADRTPSGTVVGSARAQTVGSQELARMERDAAVTVAEIVRQVREAEASHAEAAATQEHLARQRCRFFDYARRRDERAALESRVLAIGCGPAESVGNDATVCASHHVGANGLLCTGGRDRHPPRLNASSAKRAMGLSSLAAVRDVPSHVEGTPLAR